MTTDDKPSIAELGRLEREITDVDRSYGHVPHQIRSAIPVLIEIAATAKRLQSVYGSVGQERDSLTALFRALNKVVP